MHVQYTVVFKRITLHLYYSGGGIFMSVNFFVHSLMYSYYAVRAAGFKVPRPISIIITASQVTYEYEVIAKQ